MTDKEMGMQKVWMFCVRSRSQPTENSKSTNAHSKCRRYNNRNETVSRKYSFNYKTKNPSEAAGKNISHYAIHHTTAKSKFCCIA